MSEIQGAWGELRAACQREPATLFEWGRIFEARAELLDEGAQVVDVARYIVDSPAGFRLEMMERELHRFERNPHKAAANIARQACAALAHQVGELEELGARHARPEFGAPVRALPTMAGRRRQRVASSG